MMVHALALVALWAGFSYMLYPLAAELVDWASQLADQLEERRDYAREAGRLPTQVGDDALFETIADPNATLEDEYWASIGEATEPLYWAGLLAALEAWDSASDGGGDSTPGDHAADQDDQGSDAVLQVEVAAEDLD